MNMHISYIENLQQNKNRQNNYSASMLYKVYILILPKRDCQIQSFGKLKHMLRYIPRLSSFALSCQLAMVCFILFP